MGIVIIFHYPIYKQQLEKKKMQRTVKTFDCLTLTAARADHHGITAFGKQGSEEQTIGKMEYSCSR